jgi:hypothetical protein
MTSEPLPTECAEVRRRLAEGDASSELLDHLADCEGCSAFAAGLVELEARLAGLPRPQPPAGAADRAIARFHAELAAHGSPGVAPHSASPAAESLPAIAPATPPQSPSAGTAPLSPSAGTAAQSRAPEARARHARRARGRRWRTPVGLAAGVAAAIALVVALVVVLGSASTPKAYAAILREAAVHTVAKKSARFDLSGTVGFSVHGQQVTTAIRGTGATVFPDRGELTEVATILGTPLTQDIVSVGNRTWTRVNGGQWAVVPVPADHTNPIDQALANPAQALNALTRVGSGYRALGTTTVDGTRVRQIQLTIPGDSFHAFGSLPEQVSHWTVVVDVSQANLVLYRLGINGSGRVSALGSGVPFNYSLQLGLYDFDARGISIQPPPVSPGSAPSAAPRPGSTGSPTATPTTRTGSSATPSRSAPTPSPSRSPSPAPAPTPTSSCSATAAAIAGSPRKSCTAPVSISSSTAS